MKKLLSVLLLLVMLLSAAACGKNAQPEAVSVYVLTGPTGVGAVQLWDKALAGQTELNYSFTAAAAPDEVVAKLSNGEADIAAISTNLAAKLYKKTDKGIKILAVNTLGVLSVLDNSGAECSSLADLKGRKIVTTGQGANPQYIIEYLLSENGLDPTKDVTIDYKAEGSELVGVWSSEPEAVIIAPAPVSTSILSKYDSAKKVLDLTEEWAKCSPGSELMMGCLVARADFCEKYPEALKVFLREYEASIRAAEADAATTGELCEKYGIVAKAAIASKALPDCHLCCITGEDMKTSLTGYLQVLFDADPSSVGEMPDDGFWYLP